MCYLEYFRILAKSSLYHLFRMGFQILYKGIESVKKAIKHLHGQQNYRTPHAFKITKIIFHY